MLDRLNSIHETQNSAQSFIGQIVWPHNDFYSLVASEHSDRLSWIFPPSLDEAEGKIEDNLRMQRLNVGFSRAQETVWFVLSKPLADYKGSIGRVLSHYSGILTNKSVAEAGETDSTSPMERQVLEWLKAVG